MTEEELKNVKELIGVKQKKMDADLQRMFESYGMNVEAPEGNLEIVGETQHITSNNFNTSRGVLMSEIETRWSELNRELCKNTKEDELPNLKVSCMRCLRTEINDLEESPVFADFQTMSFVKKEQNIRTFTNRSGRKEKVELGVDYFFECKVCNHKLCVSIEEEQS